MKSEVFNNSIGSPYGFDYPKLTKEQDQQIIAGLFEQLLIFDRITISTNRLNFTLFFLISRLGINTVERLFDNGYIKLMIWSPLIVTGGGRQRKDGSMDESVIYGQPPVVAAALGEKTSTLRKTFIRLYHISTYTETEKEILHEKLKKIT